MAETDYNEILLEAIDAIVVSRISEVNFDRTIVATIVDASKAKDGEYVLSDGSVQFTAYSSSDKYKENDRVNVLIPSNDFSSTEKTILGKTSANANDIPITYVSPLEKIVPMETNYAAGLKGGITANSETEIFQLTNAEWIEVNESTLGYDTLCVSARFKTLLNDYDIRQGRYGLLVQLKTKNGYIHALTLDSAKDMFGNPYGYSMYLTQEQTYHLNLQDNIVGIKIDLYQMKDFKYNDGVNSELQVLPVMPYNNILVDNINVSFGYNAEQVEDNTVKIGTADSLTYNNIKDALVTKKLTLTWYNKDENNKYLGFSDGHFAGQDKDNPLYEIKWYHNQNNEEWALLSSFNDETIANVEINLRWAINEYKAIVTYDGNEYSSNILSFKAETGYDSNIHDSLNMNLTLHHNPDNSLDSYSMYGEDSAIINSGDASVNRELYFSYEGSAGNLLEPDVLNGAKAYFYIPLNQTMLELPYKIAADAESDLNNYKRYSITYPLTSDKNSEYFDENGNIKIEKKTFKYRIKSVYNPLFTNNEVILKIIDKNGFEYSTTKRFVFSSHGTAGTDYTLIIEDPVNKIATLYDANYKKVEKAADEFTWYYYNLSRGLIARSNEQSANTGATGYIVTEVKTSVPWVGKNVTISSRKAISYLAENKQDYSYQGPVTIVYDSNGVKPKYYDGDIALLNKNDGAAIPNITWQLAYYSAWDTVINPNNDVKADYPQLTIDNENGMPRLKAPNIYLTSSQYGLVLEALENGIIVYRQPLIILQNQYASSLMNSWDGQLVIDQNNNRILSAMMAAGTKDSSNRFTGVVMGQVAQMDDNSLPIGTHGLFGYHEGAQSFGFKIDGKAFIGKSGTGRIEFDGDYGVIKSAKYSGDTLQSSGSKWDLANGSLIMDGANGYFKFNEDNNGKLEMKISGVDIILQDEDQNLTTYISTAVDGIRSTVESYIIDYTGVGTLAAPDANYFDVTIQNYEGNLDDIFTPGAALLVKFREDNTNGQYRYLNIVGSDIDNSRDGQTGFQVYLNGKLIRPDNPLTWLKDDEITFILQELRGNKYWVVGNESIYSTISQTVNSIEQRVVGTENNVSTLVVNTEGITGDAIKRGKDGFSFRLTDKDFKVGAVTDYGKDTEKFSPTLTVTEKGATFTGTITADAGEIAGWDIGASPTYGKFALSKTATNNGVTYETGMRADSNPQPGHVAFYVKSTKDNWANQDFIFYVTYSGQLIARNAVIEGNSTFAGELKAATGSFTGTLTATFIDLNSATTKIEDLDSNQIGKFDKVEKFYTRASVQATLAANNEAIFTAILDKWPDTNKETLTAQYDAYYITTSGKESTTKLIFEFQKNKLKAEIIIKQVSAIGENADTLEIIVEEKGITAVALNGNFVPAIDATNYLGLGSRRWLEIYAKEGVINTSDEHLKNIQTIDNKYEEVFDNLSPVIYKWIDDEKSNYHFGFGAQSVQRSFNKSQLNSDNYAIVNTSGDYLGLKYSEFIALNTWQIQKLKMRITELEKQLNEQKE